MQCSERKNRNRRLLLHSNGLTFCALLTILLVFPQRGVGQHTSLEDTIRAIMDEQVAAWNRGDIEGYMHGYWESDSTVFTSGGTQTKGYSEVLSRYKQHYDTRKKMGELSFRELVIQLLSPTVAVATGIWQLSRDSDKPWGRFTLIFEKKPEGWRITHDHTSSSER